MSAVHTKTKYDKDLKNLIFIINYYKKITINYYIFSQSKYCFL
ncbi:hypothetical protein SMITH_419 [Smithella sp. ME-1]|uniref:Uncharacterized protein n=1 Tax=hydrocarbon metagenome TaxID=938273 RepID=A0A0W8FN79_9ZZZZ|nr:hypothetical protein SMITH_419 [Smithella sp. ME-1]